MPDKYQNKYRIPSARAPWWNYDKNGAYYVTICTAGMVNYFWNISPESPVETLHATSLPMSEIGQIARQFWLEIPSHFQFVELDEFVIMPNHVHGIIIINRDMSVVDYDLGAIGNHPFAIVEPLHATALPGQPTQPTQPGQPGQSGQPIQTKNLKMAGLSPKTGSLSSVIRSFKSAVTNWCNKNELNFGWQSRFHDHIIRTDAELDRIREYILNNPSNWNIDKFFKNCQYSVQTLHATSPQYHENK